MISREFNYLSIPSPQTLLEILRTHHLLNAGRLRWLMRRQATQSRSVRAWLEILVGRGWLTTFQAEQVLSGRVSDLVVGHYCILDRLGSGGAGQVFKAEHRWLQRPVALKILAGYSIAPPDHGKPCRSEGE